MFRLKIGLAECIFNRVRKKIRSIEVCDGNIVKPEEIGCSRRSGIEQGDGMLHFGPVERRQVCFSPHTTL